MTVRDIAIMAASVLQAEEAEAALSAAGDAADSDVKTLVRAVNLAAAELCSDGFPLCVTDEVYSSGKIIPLAALSRSPSTIKSVLRRGHKCAYTVDSGGITVPRDDRYTITYTAVPEQKALDDEVETGALADIIMLAYLAARNYCLITGRTDEASIWDQMYLSASEKKRLSRRVELPGRCWR